MSTAVHTVTVAGGALAVVGMLILMPAMTLFRTCHGTSVERRLTRTGLGLAFAGAAGVFTALVLET